MTASCALSVDDARPTTTAAIKRRRNIIHLLDSLKAFDRRPPLWQVQITGDVDLHPMPFADGDGRQPVEEPVHHLGTRLARGICRVACNDDGPVAVALPKTRGRDELREAADQSDGAGGTEGRPVVVIHAVAQAGVSELIQAAELLDAHRASVRHQDPVESDSQTGLTKVLNGTRFADHSRAGRYQDVLSAVRIDGFVTRHTTGAAAEPSRRFVSTASITVPSRTPLHPGRRIDRLRSVFGGLRLRRPVSASAAAHRERSLAGRTHRQRRPSRRSHHSRRDVIERRSLSARRGRRRGTSSVSKRRRRRDAAFRTPTDDDVAREQAFVLAPPPLVRDRVWRPLPLILCVARLALRRLLVDRLSRLSGRLLVEHSQSLLIVANAIGTRTPLHRLEFGRGVTEGSRMPGDEDDQQDPSGDGHHQPGLNAASAARREGPVDGR